MRNRQYDLPPLDQLEAFEAAARHLSFTRAADELALTQSAVSRQVAALEAFFGVPLFQRLHRALRLSDEGQLLQRTVVDVLQQLHQTSSALRGAARLKTVVVTTTPGFAGPVADPAAGRLHRVAARRGRAHLGQHTRSSTSTATASTWPSVTTRPKARARRRAPVRRGGAAGVQPEAAPRCRTAAEAARGPAPPLSAAHGRAARARTCWSGRPGCAR